MIADEYKCLKLYCVRIYYRFAVLKAVAQTNKNTYIFGITVMNDDDGMKEIESKTELLERYGFTECDSIQTWEG
jgi:hypothetical protein